VPPRTLGRVRPLFSLSGLPGRVVRAVEATLNDAITSADTLLGWIPSPVRVGGLRAGLVTANLDGSVLHIMLERYTFVPGVALSGNLDVTADEATASVHVRGRLAGDLVLTSGGSVTGTLGKRPIALSVQTRLPHAAARTAAEVRQLPPIP